MVIQVAPDRLPPGFVQRTDALHIRLVNVRINRLDEIFFAAHELGEALGNVKPAEAWIVRVNAQLAGVQKKAAGRAPVRVLLCLDETAVYVVGRGNFVDDVLTVAGGTNVITGDNPWPSIDRETLVALDPDVIIQLLPDAPPQIVNAARATWATLPQLRAVKNGQVHVMTEWYALQPGAQVGELAQKFANAIHAR